MGSTPCIADNAPQRQPTEKPQHSRHHALWMLVTQDGRQHMAGVAHSRWRSPSGSGSVCLRWQSACATEATHQIVSEWRRAESSPWGKGYSAKHMEAVLESPPSWHPGLHPVHPLDPGSVTAAEGRREAAALLPGRFQQLTWTADTETCLGR